MFGTICQEQQWHIFIKKEGDFIYDENGVTRLTQNRDVEIFLPPFTAGHIGGINKVFGGGNAAEVRGDTNISIVTVGED